jgi:hypothetical protein
MEGVDLMRFFALASTRKLLLVVLLASFLSFASTPAHAQDDPPSQAGRLSSLSGTVSIQPADTDDWGQAVPNLSLGPGDRIFTDSDGRAEIQVGQSFLRIGPNSDVSFVESTPSGISFGVAQGSIHMRTMGLWEGQSVYVNTPNGSASLNRPGELRVDVLPDQDSAIFTNFSNDSLITGAGGFSQYIGMGEALELSGTNPVFSQWLQVADSDDLDNWSRGRDRQITRSASYRYVSPEIPGAYELDAYGNWVTGTEYGVIWYPHDVPIGWAPYHYGHWVNHEPWGWVWVEDEAWGYAPFHYGRWVFFTGRWGWVPGPPSARPVWSPAQVVFAAGIRVGGVSVSAWFPLGPGEPYRPWYQASPRYIDQINRSNISESPRVRVQTTYVNINISNITYVNRSIGATAMRHEDFAAGRPARQTAVVVDNRIFNQVKVQERPEPQPTRQSFVAAPPTRPVPVKVERPVVINESGKLISPKPGAKAVEPPVKAVQQPRPPAGRKVVAPPVGAGTRSQTPANKSAAPVKPETTPALAPQSKPTAQPTAKPTTEPTSKPASQPEVVQPAVRPSQQQGERPAAQPAERLGGASPVQPQVSKPEVVQPAVRPTPQQGEKPAAQPAERPGGASPVQPQVSKPEVVQPAVRRTPQQGEKPAAQPTERPGVSPVQPQVSKPEAKPTSKPTAEPATKPTTKAEPNKKSDKNKKDKKTDNTTDKTTDEKTTDK